jgi:hypothetical protein
MDMNKFLTVMIAVLISSQAAMAAQYTIYVTGSTHVSQTQTELNSLVQKQILVDTSAKTVRLQLAPVCNSGERCPEYIRSVTLALTQFDISHSGQVNSVRAEGNLDLNGKPTAAIIQISLNADNAMDIAITNSSECKSTHSSFVGGPASLSTAVIF